MITMLLIWFIKLNIKITDFLFRLMLCIFLSPFWFLKGVLSK